MKQEAGTKKKIIAWFSKPWNDDWDDDFQTFDDLKECIEYVDRVYPTGQVRGLMKIELNGMKVRLVGGQFVHLDGSVFTIDDSPLDDFPEEKMPAAFWLVAAFSVIVMIVSCFYAGVESERAKQANVETKEAREDRIIAEHGKAMKAPLKNSLPEQLLDYDHFKKDNAVKVR